MTCQKIFFGHRNQPFRCDKIMYLSLNIEYCTDVIPGKPKMCFFNTRLLLPIVFSVNWLYWLSARKTWNGNLFKIWVDALTALVWDGSMRRLINLSCLETLQKETWSIFHLLTLRFTLWTVVACCHLVVAIEKTQLYWWNHCSVHAVHTRQIEVSLVSVYWTWNRSHY